ncbi:MAG: pyridine nucleotide-disulfide oxidoreductase [Lentisphaerae bacterium GWF2_45_14]|nr:MAG: pyridine nucleotide-disulfide oxidoreductase [Lentisphaerae bacterium GWF2_45_14]
MIKKTYDAIIIGGGAAGLSAAWNVAKAGFSTAIIERENCLGGILNQCIHTGFGLHRFGKELSGPEYAEMDIDLVAANKVDSFINTTVFEIRSNGILKSVFASSAEGVTEFETRAVILSMGCRERNRGNLGIPGTRPSGIMTAGLAQRLLNIEGYLPGRKAVIIGSGDIGLIMARRLTWSGAIVMGVIEILPYPSGLARNIAQCLDDFEIPLYLGHTVSAINGKERVESVDVSPFKDGVPSLSGTFKIDCDTVLISAGLIPENELSVKAGVKLSNATGGPYVDSSMMTNVPGIFACGNVLHVHDLVDYVSEESENCGSAVVSYLSSDECSCTQGNISAGSNIKYIVPSKYRTGIPQKFYMRSLMPFENAMLTVKCADKILFERKLKYVRPPEMQSFTLTPEMTDGLNENSPEINVSLTEV